MQDLTVLETLSLTQRQGSERETRADWYPQRWKSWQDGRWHDQKWTQASAASSWWDDAKLWDSWQDLYRRSFWLFLSKVGYFRTSRVSWVLCKLSDVEEGCSEVEDDHGSPCGEAGYQGHELFGLDGASIRGCKDLRGSISATRRCGLNLEGFGCQGRLDPGGRVQTSLVTGTVQRGKRQGRVSETIHVKKVGADRGTWGTVLKEGARLTKQSEQNLNTLLNGSTEFDDVARALNMLDVESQEGIIKAPVKRVVHSFMETGTFTESQQCEEETDETNDQSDEEEEELCPPLEDRWPPAGLHRWEKRTSVRQRQLTPSLP